MALSIGDARSSILDLKKLTVYDDIKFSNDLHKIKYIDVGSSIANNFMLISIDGTIYKYDLASHELLYQFKASAFRGMQVFDNDQKIISADQNQIKLWEMKVVKGEDQVQQITSN